MGGSSLGPEVLGETFGKRGGYPTLHVLDSTDPQQIAAFEKKVTLATTLVIVSSKSGGTLEPNILKAYFWDAMQKAVGEGQGGRAFRRHHRPRFAHAEGRREAGPFPPHLLR